MTRHGARSQRSVRKRAGYLKQAILKPLHLRQRDLEPVDRWTLSQWAEIEARIALMDEWADENGWLDEEGRPPSFSATYYAARNSATRLLTKLRPILEKAAQAKQADGGSELERHLRENYPSKAKP
jgi:hypothetical protein